MRRLLITLGCALATTIASFAQINTEKVMTVARNALFFEDYLLSIQYFNQVINAKSYLSIPYFYRGLAKYNLDDFRGAEADCTESILRNPFVVRNYQVRGLARLRMDKYSKATEDFRKALFYDPENINIRHNISVCRIKLKDYKGAINELDTLLSIDPNYAAANIIRGNIYETLKDTSAAKRNYEEAILKSPYDGEVWSARSSFYLKQKHYKKAEKDLDKAILLVVKNSGVYINRALARYHQNNLRGAMADYDKAILIAPKDLLAHFNRGLLRTQVGDDNRAILDFDFVINQEPDNMTARYNRALLRKNTGDYTGAIMDLSQIIAVYKSFIPGYQLRANLRKKTGDLLGAKSDEGVVLQANIDRFNTSKKKKKDTSEKTRKQSDKNLKNYRKLMVADTEEDSKYESAYRGKIQDKKVKVKLEKMFVLSYYEKNEEIKRQVNYYRAIDELNQTVKLPNRLLITNRERALATKEIKKQFNRIQESSATIADKPTKMLYFMRSINYYLVQDFESAIADLTKLIVQDDSFFPAYFQRALIRYKQIEYEKANKKLAFENQSKIINTTAVDYEIVRSDLDRAIELAPDFVYAYYNRANLLTTLEDYPAALVDYSRAITLYPNFSEAYYNRGLTYLYMGNKKKAFNDLSRAGELGIALAYNVLKKFTGKDRY